MVFKNGDGIEPTKCRKCEEHGKTTVKPRYRMYEAKGIKGYMCPECACEVIMFAEELYAYAASIFDMTNNDEDY